MYKSRDLYRILVESSPDAICVLGADGKIFYSNNQTAVLLGYSKADEITGNCFSKYISDKDCRRASDSISNILVNSGAGRFEFSFIKKDGSLLTCETNLSLIDLKEVSPAVLVVLRDVTEKKQTEKNLSLLASFPENNTEPIVELLESGKISYINPAAKRLFPEILTEGSNHPILAGWKNLINDVESKARGGIIREIKVGNSLYRQNVLFIKANKCIRIYVQDITERVKAEELLRDELKEQVLQQTQELRAANERLRIEIEGHKKTYESLKESEVRYRNAIDFTYTWEYWINPEGNYIYVSPSCRRISEYSSDEFINDPKLMGRIIHPDDYLSFFKHHELDRGPADLIDFRIITRSGKVRWIHHICQSVYNEEGKWLGRRASNRDVTEFKKAEEALKTASAYNRNLIETSLDPLVTIGPDGRITDVNSATERVTEHTRDELIGTDFADYFTDPEKARAGYKQVFEKGFVKDYPLEIRQRNGGITPVLYNASIYKDDSGNVIGVFAAARDITELKIAESALKDAFIYNRRLIETSLDPLVAIGPDGKITDVNTATEAITGCSRNELVGTDFADYFTEPERARDGYKRVFNKGFVRDYPLEIRHRDGRITSVLYNASVYRDNNNKIIGVFAAARDITERKKIETELDKYREHLEELVRERTIELEKEITERKKMEQALVESRENFRLITQTTPVLIVVSRISDGTIIFSNQEYQQAFGYSEDEILGVKGKDFYWNPAERDEIIDKFKRDGFVENCELKVKHRDGSPFWISTSMRSIFFAGEKALLGASIDITDRKIAEDKIRQHVEYTTSVINNMPGLFYAIDAKGNMLETNDRFSDVSGYASQDIKNMKGTDFFRVENIKLIENKIREVFEKGEAFVEANFITKDGKAIPYFFTGSRIIKDGKPILIGMGVDITERKNREGLIEASLREKEVLLKEIHHRVKNNLQLISSILNLQSIYIKDNKALEAFKESQNRIRSMALIHEKLYKSRFLSNINIREYINDISAHLFSSYFHMSRSIKLKLDIEDLELEVDKCIAIGLILNELISNSLKHGFSEDPEGEMNIYLHRSGDHKLVLVYSDDGKGFPENYDFRSTETLGLQLVISLIEQHGGTIEMESCKGVKFTITISV